MLYIESLVLQISWECITISTIHCLFSFLFVTNLEALFSHLYNLSSDSFGKLRSTSRVLQESTLERIKAHVKIFLDGLLKKKNAILNILHNSKNIYWLKLVLHDFIGRWQIQTLNF